MANPVTGGSNTSGPAYGFPDPRTEFNNPDQSISLQGMRPLAPGSSYYTRLPGGTVIEDGRFHKRPRVPGLRPVARRDNTPGVGITPGYLQWNESSIITSAASSRNNSQETMPTLGGTALDHETPPRETVAAGDKEAWIIFKEQCGSAFVPKIVFVDLDAGPGALDRDERAVRLATFTVSFPTGTTTPTVVVNETFVYDNLIVWSPRHQFKVIKTAANKVQMDGGYAMYLKGPSFPLVTETVEFPQSSEFTITQNSAVWVGGYCYVTQNSYSYYQIPSTYNYIYFYHHRLSTFGYPFSQLRTSDPSRGTDTYTPWTNGAGYVYYKVADIEWDGSEAFVSHQYINGPIYVNELADGKIQ